MHVLPVTPEVLPALLSGATRELDAKRRTSLFRQTVESLRPVRHHTAMDHCSKCPRASSTVANPGSTKENVVPSCAASMSAVYQLEWSMNQRNSSDLGFSGASRSTFLHTTFPQRSWIANFTQSRRLFAHTSGLTGSPLHSKLLHYH